MAAVALVVPLWSICVPPVASGTRDTGDTLMERTKTWKMCPRRCCPCLLSLHSDVFWGHSNSDLKWMFDSRIWSFLVAKFGCVLAHVSPGKMDTNLVFFPAFSAHMIGVSVWLADVRWLSNVSFISFLYSPASVSFGRQRSTDFSLQCLWCCVWWIVVKICTKCNQDLCILQWIFWNILLRDWLSTYPKDISGI